MSLVTGAFVVAFLIGVNALYVAGEFAAIGARRSRIQQLAGEGHRIAGRLVPVLRDPHALDRWISCCQIGITLSSLGLGAYGEAKIAPLLEPVLTTFGMRAVSAHSTAAFIVLIALTLLQMVLGELMPKSVALQYPSKTALFTAVPVGWSLRLLSPFISVLNGTGNALLAVLGIRQPERRHVHSPEEIEVLIAESSRVGLLAPEEKEQLGRALRLGVRSVRQVMVPRGRIEAIEASATPAEVLRAISGAYTRLPVYRGRFDNVVGLLHAKDVVVDQVRGRELAPVHELMTPILSIGEDALAHEVLSQLREHHTRLAIVRNRVGAVIGLVTLQDVLGTVLGAMPADEPPRAARARRT